MKHKKYEWDGRKVSPFEFWRLAKAKWKFEGLSVSPIMGWTGQNGDIGCQKNPDAPPAKMCDLIDDAFADMTEEQRQSLIRESREEVAARRMKEAV